MSTSPKLKRRRGWGEERGTCQDTDFRIDLTVNEFTIQLGPVSMEGGLPSEMKDGLPSYRPIRAKT